MSCPDSKFGPAVGQKGSGEGGTVSFVERMESEGASVFPLVWLEAEGFAPLAYGLPFGKTEPDAYNVSMAGRSTIVSRQLTEDSAVDVVPLIVHSLRRGRA